MPSIINSNVMSLNAQRSLGKSQDALATAIQRLSSGMRINSAKDDAAGLAIAERMSSQIRGLDQAARNANDAISLAQTAEGALDTVNTNLQRIRELAVQASNGTLSTSDRAALDVEAQALKDEIDRVAQATSFNGTKLIDGSFANVDMQVGSEFATTDSITISSIVNAQSSALGTTTKATIGSSSGFTGFATALVAGDVTIEDSGGNAIDIGAVSAAANASERASQIRDAVNAVADQTGVFAISENSTTVSLVADFSIVIAGAENDAAVAGFANGTTAAATTTGFASMSLTTASGALNTIDFMDSAISAVNTARASLGAVQSRFESAISTLNTQSENLTAARSRIRDADFAAETANLTRAQILQQAGTAMVAQANSAPQTALSLLG